MRIVDTYLHIYDSTNDPDSGFAIRPSQATALLVVATGVASDTLTMDCVSNLSGLVGTSLASLNFASSNGTRYVVQADLVQGPAVARGGTLLMDPTNSYPDAVEYAVLALADVPDGFLKSASVVGAAYPAVALASTSNTSAPGQLVLNMGTVLSAAGPGTTASGGVTTGMDGAPTSQTPQGYRTTLIPASTTGFTTAEILRFPSGLTNAVAGMLVSFTLQPAAPQPVVGDLRMPAGSAYPITANVPFSPSKSMYVGGAGNATFVLNDGSRVTFRGLTAGQVLPISAVGVLSASLTASYLVALY